MKKAKSLTQINTASTTKEVKAVLEVVEFFKRAHPISSIAKYLKGELKFNDAKCRLILERAQLVMRSDNLKSQLEHLEQSLAKLDDLYQKNYLLSELKECRAIVVEHDKLFTKYMFLIDSESD